MNQKLVDANKRRFLTKYNYITKDILSNLYDKLPISGVALELKLRKDIVRRLLLAYKIKLRSLSEHLSLPGIKQQIADKMKIIQNKSEVKIAKSERSKAAWAARGYKAPLGLLTKMKTQEYREKMQQIMYKRHKTEFNRIIRPLISIGLKRCWDNQIFRTAITKHSTELFVKLRTDEEAQKRYQAAHCIALTKPQYKKQRSQLAKFLWSKSEYRQKQSEKSIKLWQSPEYRIAILNKRINQPVVSTQQRTLYGLLDGLKLSYIPEKVIGYYSFDCFLSDYNILIEVNGDYWHSLPKAIRNDKAKSTYIERYFPEYQLKTLWEHEFRCEDKIINLLSYWTGTKPIIKFDLINITLKLLDCQIANEFIQKYHYLGKIGNNSYRFGFYLGEELIAVVIYGSITRKESATKLNLLPIELLELTRLCIHPAYQIKNLASTIIAKTIKKIREYGKHKCLITFADSTFNHSGTIYKASNWIFDGKVDPSYWYTDKSGYVMHKKTLWDHAQSLKMSEEEFARSHGYIKRFGLSKLRFIYWLN